MTFVEHCNFPANGFPTFEERHLRSRFLHILKEKKLLSRDSPIHASRLCYPAPPSHPKNLHISFPLHRSSTHRIFTRRKPRYVHRLRASSILPLNSQFAIPFHPLMHDLTLKFQGKFFSPTI